MWRLKWSISKNSFRDKLRNLKSWETIYSKKCDKDITSTIYNWGIEWNFKTEKVMLIKLRSWETERWVLITKLE